MGCAAVVLLLLTAAAGAAADDGESQLEASRALAEQFGSELKTTLLTALQAGGPVAAMSVCAEAAPNIAARVSRQSGAKIGRTSERYRSPVNAPEPWQRKVLAELFAPAVLQTDRRVEYISHAGADVRYMQAIRLGPVCAVCHGTDLSEPVTAFLDAHYPHDLARGFRPGELRGAFIVVWPGRSDDSP